MSIYFSFIAGLDGGMILSDMFQEALEQCDFGLNSYIFLSDFSSQNWSSSSQEGYLYGSYYEPFRSSEGSSFSIKADGGVSPGFGYSWLSFVFISNNFDKLNYKGTSEYEVIGDLDTDAIKGSTFNSSSKYTDILSWSYIGDKSTNADDTWMSAYASSKSSFSGVKNSDEYNVGTSQYKLNLNLTESFTSANYKLSLTNNISTTETYNGYFGGDITSSLTSDSFIQYKFYDLNSRFSLTFDKLILTSTISTTALELRNFVASTDGLKIETTFFKGMLSIDQVELFSDESFSLVPQDNFEQLKSSYYSLLEPITLSGNNVITVITTSGEIVDASTGNDKILGNVGDDYLIGGAGRDTLIGGAGSDQFIFYIGDTSGSVSLADTIQDFKTLDGDLIDLSDVDANINVVGNQAFANAAATIGSTAAAYSLWFNATSKVLYGDTNGVTSTTEIAIKLVGVAALNLIDVVL